MIPVRLALRNFMPYRDNVPPLYFGGIHTASIWGDNGNGKSALIDALTWALWGKTRAKSDDELIHQGQDETGVEFDFAIGPQTYRVIRKHARPKRRRASGQTILELQIAAGDGFKSISGNTIPQTQQEIIKLLHMDYETFKNSAYLRQGHADEFTVAKPAERKQVLADILGLALYDRLEEQAKELAKQQETEKEQSARTIEDISNELAQQPAYETELAQAQNDLGQLEKVVNERTARLNELRQKKELLGDKQVQLSQLEERLAETARMLERWNEQSKQHHSHIREYEELIARRVAIEEGYARLVEIKQRNDELERQFRQSVNLERQKSQLESKIKEAGQNLLTEHALAANKISELEASSRKLPQLRDELQQVETALNQVIQEEATLVQKRQASQELRAYVQDLESSRARLAGEIAEIQEKLSLLLAEGGAKCPLCETELGREGLKLVEAKYTAEKQAKADALKSRQSEMAGKRQELGLLEDETSRLEARLKQERIAAQSKASLLSQEIDQVKKASQQLDEAKSRLAEIEERLARKDYASGEQEALRQLEGELARLGYDAPQHEQMRQQQAGLEQYEEPKRRLEEADRLIVQEKEAAARTEQAAQESLHSLEADNRKKQELAVELGSLPQLARDLVQAEAEYQALSTRQKQGQELVGSIKGKLQRCAELEVKKREEEQRLTEASKEERIYRDLAQAFGKKGIPAWLVEMALPEIEVEANKLLARMTDNRMHVKMETQREGKTGGVIDTLDITIADELGTRPYEMFSGGEAFRINFAIRIALSKLLAKRAGAPLRTIIIDEGFGTQDSTGLEKVKEAIISIQDDFDKVLIITHVEEFRDAFPSRIDVVKTAEGSMIEVN